MRKESIPRYARKGQREKRSVVIYLEGRDEDKQVTGQAARDTLGKQGNKETTTAYFSLGHQVYMKKTCLKMLFQNVPVQNGDGGGS